MKKIKPILMISFVISFVIISSGIVFADNCSEPDIFEYHSRPIVHELLQY
ncbi:hypothetical protein [Proteiniborus sp.]